MKNQLTFLTVVCYLGGLIILAVNPDAVFGWVILFALAFIFSRLLKYEQ